MFWGCPYATSRNTPAVDPFDANLAGTGVFLFAAFCVVASIVSFVMGVWFIIGAFVAGIGWGLTLLLWPVASFFFPPLILGYPVFLLVLIIRHWEILKIPVLTNLIIGLVLTLIQVAIWLSVMSFVKSPDESYQDFFKRFKTEAGQSIRATVPADNLRAKLKLRRSGLSDTFQVKLKSFGDQSFQKLSAIVNKTETKSSDIVREYWAKVQLPFIPTTPRTAVKAPDENAQWNESLLKASEDGNLERIRSLFEKGAEVNAVSPQGETALMYAAGYGHEEAVKLLLEHEADASIRSPEGQTALDIAVENDRSAIAALLQQAMDLETLSVLIRRDHPERVRAKLADGSDPNIKSGSGETPLMEAAAYGCAEIVKILLESGADRSLVNSQGQTALDIARLNQRSAIVDILQPAEPAKMTEVSAS